MSKRKRAAAAPKKPAVKTTDSFQNPLTRTGTFMPNALEATQYPLTRFSRDWQTINSLYRSHWVVRRIIDVIPEDMTKNGYKITSQLEPDALKKLEAVFRRTSTHRKLLQGLKWGRLYGGAGGLVMIKGQEDMLDQPLELDSVMPDDYKGLLILDRWSGITPDAELVEDPGDPEYGLPRYYQIECDTLDRGLRVHHSRILRFMGRPLPYLEELAENYWGASEIEHIIDELRKRDNVSWNIAMLTFMANLRVMKIDGMGMMLATGNENAQRDLYNTVQAMNTLMNNQSIQILGENDEYESHQYTFGGLGEVYDRFMMDLAGAAETPVTKLFGRSPAGMNATGESDMQNYYDTIEEKQENELRPVYDKLLPIIMMSTFGAVPDDFDYEFNPVRRAPEEEMADLASKNTDSVTKAFQAGLISQKVALKELQQQSEQTGMWTNITDEDIDKADDEVMSPDEGMGGMMGMGGGDEPPDGPKDGGSGEPPQDTPKFSREGRESTTDSWPLSLDGYPKDPNPKNWRTINGSKVHLTKGKIDGGAGGKFAGNAWSGKIAHEYEPEPKHAKAKNKTKTQSTPKSKPPAPSKKPPLGYINQLKGQYNAASDQAKKVADDVLTTGEVNDMGGSDGALCKTIYAAYANKQMTKLAAQNAIAAVADGKKTTFTDNIKAYYGVGVDTPQQAEVPKATASPEIHKPETKPKATKPATAADLSKSYKGVGKNPKAFGNFVKQCESASTEAINDFYAKNPPATLKDKAKLKKAQDAYSAKVEKHLTDKVGAETVAAFKQNLAAALEDGAYGMMVDSNVLLKIFDSHFKNTYETGTSNGLDDTETHDAFANSAFKCKKTAENIPGFEMEKYGLLLPKDDKAPPPSAAKGYGDVIVRFKKDRLKGRVTYTLGDSMTEWGQNPEEYVSGDADHPSLAGCFAGGMTKYAAATAEETVKQFAENGKPPEKFMQTLAGWGDDHELSYLELQYHGALTTADIESVTIQKSKASTKLIEAMKAKGIAVNLI